MKIHLLTRRSIGWRKATRRSGSLYIAVLGVSLLVSMMTLCAMRLALTQIRVAQDETDRRIARKLASSAIELAMAEFNSNTNWQTDYTFDIEYPTPGISINGGTLTWKLVDLGSGERRLDGIGRVDEAECLISVDLQLAPELDCSILSGDTFLIGSTTNTITAGWGPVATNGNLSNLYGTITGDVEAQSVTTASGTITGTVTQPARIRGIPDVDGLIDYYEALGTVVSPSGGGGTIYIEEIVLSPSSNPFGTANADGIYVIDAAGKNVKIQYCRIVGTLIVKNVDSDKKVTIDKSVNWEPAYANFPALIVEGDLCIKLEDSVLDESPGWMPNLNPSGTPWQGETDGDTSDTYPSALAGIFYCSGGLTFDGKNNDNTPDIDGMVIAGGTCTLEKNVHPNITYNPAFLSAPGFGTVATTGPTELRSYTGAGGTNDVILNTKRWAQYFKPTLPTGALTWRITSVELQLQTETPGDVRIAIATADGSSMPDTIIEEQVVNSSSMPSVMNWHTINFTDNSNLNPNAGFCITATTSLSTAPARIAFQPSGMSASNSAMVTGDGTGWTTVATDAALKYRVHGVYTTTTGKVCIKPDSWRQTATP